MSEALVGLSERRPILKKAILASIAAGSTATAAAKAAGVSVSVLYSWRMEDPEFDEALDEAYLAMCHSVEDALYRSAVGAKQTEETTDYDGEGNVTKRRVVEKTMAPQWAAGIIVLKNRMPRKWRDNPKQDDLPEAHGITINVIPAGAEPDRLAGDNPAQLPEHAGDQEDGDADLHVQSAPPPVGGAEQ